MSAATNDLDAYWMPFTANRDFKKKPRIIKAASGHHYTANDGTRLYDMFSGLWTSGLGHCHPKIVAAVQAQVAELDYCMTAATSRPLLWSPLQDPQASCRHRSAILNACEKFATRMAFC